MTQECNESSELNLFDDMSYTVKITMRISLNPFSQMKLYKSIDSTWILSSPRQMEWNEWTNINFRRSMFGTHIWLCVMRPISPQCWVSVRVFWQIASAMQGLTAKLCVREYESSCVYEWETLNQMHWMCMCVCVCNYRRVGSVCACCCAMNWKSVLYIIRFLLRPHLLHSRTPLSV